MAKAVETGIIFSIAAVKIELLCVWKKVKQQIPLIMLTWYKFKFVEKFSELIKNLSDVPKSDDFVYFTKITAAIWSISEIIRCFYTLFNQDWIENSFYRIME